MGGGGTRGFPGVATGPALAVVTIATGTSATTIKELWKNKVYYSQILKSTQPTHGPTVRSQ